MAKKFDALILTLLSFILLFLWSRFFIHNIVWSLIFSSALSFLIVLCVRAFSVKIKKRPYSVERLSREFALRGNEYVADYLAKTLNNPFIEASGNILKLGGILLICNFKFSNLSSSDIASAYQTAQKRSAKKVVMLCRGADRPAIALSTNLDVKFEIVKTGALYRYLQRMNALPELDKDKFKFSLKYIFDVALKRQNAKYYIFSGIMLLFLSYFTPLKLYYLCFGTSLLVLAILCLSPLGHVGEESKHKIFDTFAGTKNDTLDNIQFIKNSKTKNDNANKNDTDKEDHSNNSNKNNSEK
ncbi:MAG TPA: hypothetical protein VJZ69_01160 [Clostridia bacterium]|nr:hypothetical protein [Clostridia bacterium]